MATTTIHRANAQPTATTQPPVDKKELECVNKEASELMDFVSKQTGLHHYLHLAKAVIFLKSTKVAFGFGGRVSKGFMLVHLPQIKGDGSSSLLNPRWSAPLFLKVRAVQFGVGLGYAHEYNWMMAMSNKIINDLSSGGHALVGIDSTMTLGTNLHERKSDVIDLSYGAYDLVNICMAKGAMLDFSFAGGSLSVDKARCRRVLGTSCSTHGVISGEIQPPEELSGLYSRLDVMAGEAVCCRPSLTAASLNRFSLGVEADRRMVTEEGTVMTEDGRVIQHAEMYGLPSKRVVAAPTASVSRIEE